MRATSLLAALGLAATGLVAAAPTATAAGSCSLYVQSRITISSPYRAVPVKLGPNCAAAGVVDAAWTAYHPTQGMEAIAWFTDGQRSDVIDVYDWDDLGRWTWRPDYAYKANYDKVYQYQPYSDVRLGSWGRVTATRNGSRVTLSTSAARYWQDGSRFISWSGARGQIQYRTPGTTTWRGLKEVYSTSTGKYSYTYTTSATRDYRVVLRATSTIWDYTSPSVRR